MKKSYVKPELNASMNGTLEGVYAYACGLCGQNPQPNNTASSNDELPQSEPDYDYNYKLYIKIAFSFRKWWHSWW